MSITKNRRLKRVRSRIKYKNRSARPVINVTISNKNISAQLIDCDNGNIIVSSTSINNSKIKKVTGIEAANILGKEFSEECNKKGVKNVVFNKGCKSYIGRIESFANSCRKSGLNF